MKTNFTRGNKDNIATAALVAISLFALASGVFASAPAAATHAPATLQKMDAIIVTAPRVAHATLDTIVVTVSRNTTHA